MPPLNKKNSAICFIGLMGSNDIFRKSQRVSAHTFERKGAFSVFLRLGGVYPPRPKLYRIKIENGDDFFI